MREITKTNPTTNFLKKAFCLSCMMVFPFWATRSATVTWDANRESDLSGYRVYYGTSSRNYSQQISVGKVTLHRVSGLEEGRSYFFAVTAVDVAGNESGFSTEVSVEIPQLPDPPPDDPPVDPTAEAIGTVVYNFPNPFRVGQQNTTMRYELFSDGDVTIDILNMDNSLVRTLVSNGFRRVGENVQDSWDGRNSQGNLVANGVYFCRIRVGKIQRFIKIVVAR